jgi:hypothetical protein
VGVLAFAAPAAAQQITPASLGQARFASTDIPAATAPAPGSTPIEIRGFVGGVFCCSESGFTVGVGVGARPFNNEKVEVTGDVGFMRLFGSNGVYFSGNGLYHFKTNEPNFNPYAGAGIGIIHIGDDTEARFQIVGGFEFNSARRHPVRPEVRFIFTEGDTTTILMVSIGLGKQQ